MPRFLKDEKLTDLENEVDEDDVNSEQFGILKTLNKQGTNQINRSNNGFNKFGLKLDGSEFDDEVPDDELSALRGLE